MSLTHAQMLHFWREVCKLQHIRQLSCTFQVGDGQIIRFSLDTWHSTYLLAIAYLQLFALCSNQSTTLNNATATQGNLVTFRRALHGILLSEWFEITNLLSSCSLIDAPDCPQWKWDAKLQFTTASLSFFP